MEAQAERDRRNIVAAMKSLTRFPVTALTDLRTAVALAVGPDAELETVSPKAAKEISTAADRLSVLIAQAREDRLLGQIVTLWTHRHWFRVGQLEPAITVARQQLQAAIDAFPVPTD